MRAKPPSTTTISPPDSRPTSNMHGLNATHPNLNNTSTAFSSSNYTSSLNKLATFGLASIVSGFSTHAGGGGLVSVGLLLSSALPVLLSYSSLLRGWVFAPAVWILDFFFPTAYIKDDGTIATEWLGPYLKTLPQFGKGKQVEVECTPYHELDQDDAEKLFWSNAYPHRSLPFATRHSFFLHRSSLIVVSKEKKKDFAIGRPKVWRMRGQRSRRGRGGGRGGDDDDDDDEEEVTKLDFIKIRALPIPFFDLARRVLALPSHPTPFLNTLADPIDSLIESAKQFSVDKMDRGPAIFTYQDHHWRSTSTARRKDIDSVILPNGQARKVLEDVRKFLDRRVYYRERGVAHRRGYLFWGEPGAGKTSLVKAIASELSLSIFYLSLSQKGMDDAELMKALSQTLPFCIVLMEDIDCAFNDNTATRTTKEDTGEDAGLKSLVKALSSGAAKDRLTMSGLLNALDGVASVEGKLIFATTNYIDRLDPALIRPGRMDSKVEFRLTSKDQLQGLFEQTHLPTKGELERAAKEQTALSTENDEKSPWPTSREEIVQLAVKFSEVVPADTFSAASIQGYLFSHQDDPAGAIEGVGEWMIQQKKTDDAIKKNQQEELTKIAKIKLKEETKLIKAALAKEAEEKKKKEAAEDSDASVDNSAKTPAPAAAAAPVTAAAEKA